MGFFKQVLSAIDKAARRTAAEQKRKIAMFNRVRTVLNESTYLINFTKNIKTAVTRYNTIKTRLTELMTMFPGDALEIEFNGKPIKTLADIAAIEEAKCGHVRDYFRGRCAELSPMVAVANSNKKREQLKKRVEKLRTEYMDLALGDAEVAALIQELDRQLQRHNEPPPSADAH